MSGFTLSVDNQPPVPVDVTIHHGEVTYTAVDLRIGFDPEFHAYWEWRAAALIRGEDDKLLGQVRVLHRDDDGYLLEWKLDRAGREAIHDFIWLNWTES